MAEINLLQQQTKKSSSFSESMPQVSGSLLLWIFGGLVLLEILAWGGMYFWKSSIRKEATLVDTQIISLDDQIKSRQGEVSEAVAAQSGFQTFSDLLEKHIYVTKLIEEMGRHTLKTQSFSGFNIEVSKNEFVVSGEVPTFTDVGRIWLGLEQSQYFRKIELVDTDQSEGDRIAVKYKLRVIARPGVMNFSNNQN